VASSRSESEGSWSVEEERTGLPTLRDSGREDGEGTVKAAILRGDIQSSDLVVALCYDQKPFYMISHSCEHMYLDSTDEESLEFHPEEDR